ncbi:hypothetical protein [Actinoplanes couchii]|uniref:hypothetical protein n=1 Tax=Actinoplanes couchii TaxID=403638 RepID=UPI00194275A0|nr:hypothetical protein [Actinoplanes couchii]MDR6320285.1 AcrR family transcriptional regulator [Actinoplanes couchii]
MDPEQLRHTIVRAALPLLAQSSSLTTAQIAQAANVPEPELLTVFTDKESILQACTAAIAATVSAATDPTEAVRQMDAIPATLPLAARLVQVIAILDAYYHRIRTDVDALYRADAAETPVPWSFDRRDFRGIGKMIDIREAVTRVLDPDEPTLALPAGILAEAFLGLALSGIQIPRPQHPALSAEQIVDLFLHGATAPS